MGTSKAIPALVLGLATLTVQATQSHDAPQTTAQKKQANPLEEAERLLNQQQFAEAEEKLHGLTAMYGNSAQLWFDLGYAQSHQGKASEAVTSYRQAVELAPTWFEANLNLGVALAKSGDNAGAQTVLRHATELKPSVGGKTAVANAWESLAHVLEDSDFRQSAAAYDKAFELNPGAVLLQVNAGRMLEKAGDSGAAQQHFQKAAEAGNSQGMALLINLLTRENRFPEAEQWLRKYVAQNPTDEKARLQLGKILSFENKPQQAIEVLQPQNGASPSPEVSRALADLYLQSKQYKQAEPLFRQLLPASPQDPALHLGLGVALLYQLKYAEAEAELINALKLKGDDPDALGYLADAARENKHYELAIRALDARAKMVGDTPKTIFIRATAYDNLHMPKQAAENYKRFLAVAGGKYPDQEFQARHRLKAILPD
jgi:Flp pilus assembly protein TadD